ncbi:MAG TPA: hypothetical protein VLK65_15010 [Vicinamibacteria bacterium]|nr:hypothetical protein [Vicinamibacteria bacterium]
MRTTFKVREKDYDLVLERRERGEGDTNQPFGATVTGQPGGPVSGTLQLTDSLLRTADETATLRDSSAEELVTGACVRSLASELSFRKLKPDFSFVVDHRWLD